MANQTEIKCDACGMDIPCCDPNGIRVIHSTEAARHIISDHKARTCTAIADEDRKNYGFSVVYDPEFFKR